MGVEIKRFGSLPDGREVHAYILTQGPLTVTISDYGCRVLSLIAPDRDGKPGDVVLGHNTLEEYLAKTFRAPPSDALATALAAPGSPWTARSIH